MDTNATDPKDTSPNAPQETPLNSDQSRRKRLKLAFAGAITLIAVILLFAFWQEPHAPTSSIDPAFTGPLNAFEEEVMSVESELRNTIAREVQKEGGEKFELEDLKRASVGPDRLVFAARYNFVKPSKEGGPLKSNVNTSISLYRVEEGVWKVKKLKDFSLNIEFPDIKVK